MSQYIVSNIRKALKPYNGDPGTKVSVNGVNNYQEDNFNSHWRRREVEFIVSCVIFTRFKYLSIKNISM